MRQCNSTFRDIKFQEKIYELNDQQMWVPDKLFISHNFCFSFRHSRTGSSSSGSSGLSGSSGMSGSSGLSGSSGSSGSFGSSSSSGSTYPASVSRTSSSSTVERKVEGMTGGSYSVNKVKRNRWWLSTFWHIEKSNNLIWYFDINIAKFAVYFWDFY